MKPITNGPLVGDQVAILDHSFHLDLVDGVLCQKSDCGGFHTRHKLILVARDLTLPAECSHTSPQEVNDCIVWNRTRDIYFFTQMRFLRNRQIREENDYDNRAM